MKNLIALLAIFLAACNDEEQPQEPPLVVLFATDREATLNGDVMYTVVPTLKARGFELVAYDLPCHGTDADGDTNPLYCWRLRIDAGQDPFGPFCAQVSADLDRRGVTRVDAVGQSRGGYVAVTCAARDPRFRNVVLLKPVTDLTKLSEFAGALVPERFSLAQYIDEMQSIDVLLRIGRDDQRVSTESAVTFGDAIGSEVQLSDTPGHFMQDEGIAAEWLSKQHQAPR